jgi:hypothetical protein
MILEKKTNIPLNCLNRLLLKKVKNGVLSDADLQLKKITVNLRNHTISLYFLSFKLTSTFIFENVNRRFKQFQEAVFEVD